MADSTSATPRRSWLSLLTGRWHACSWVAAVLVLLFLVFCNLPGQVLIALDEHEVDLNHQIEHGWPFTYLIRDDQLEMAPDERTVASCFAPWNGFQEFRISALLVNVCVVLLLSLAVGAAFEIWRRQRRKVWHLHLRDCLAAMLVVGLVAGWYVHQKRQYVLQQRESSEGSVPGNSIKVLYVQPGGITWLRTWLGESSMEFLDWPYHVIVDNKAGWTRLSKFRTVRFVSVRVSSTTEELRELATLPHLECLQLWEPFHEGRDTWDADLPPLPSLRSLEIQRIAHGRRLDRLPSLEILHAALDERAFREIRPLRNLRKLHLQSTDRGDDLALLPSLPSLSELTLHDGEINATALENISRCRHLKKLTFDYMPFDVAVADFRGIHHLAKLPQLHIEVNGVVASDLKAVEAHFRVLLRELNRAGRFCFGIPRSELGPEEPERTESFLPENFEPGDLNPSPDSPGSSGTGD